MKRNELYFQSKIRSVSESGARVSKQNKNPLSKDFLAISLHCGLHLSGWLAFIVHCSLGGVQMKRILLRALTKTK